MSEPFKEIPFAPYFERMETTDGVTKLNLVHGCSLRDWFAGQALAGYVANDSACKALAGVDLNESKTYAELSDAMLKARAAK